jgi:hypothetical protein
MLKGRLTTYPGRVTLVVHDPIDTRALSTSDRRELAERVRKIVAAAAESDLDRQPPDTVAA